MSTLIFQADFSQVLDAKACQHQSISVARNSEKDRHENKDKESLEIGMN